jgi:malonyl CoA-acyl carrier protein transacylase
MTDGRPDKKAPDREQVYRLDAPSRGALIARLDRLLADPAAWQDTLGHRGSPNRIHGERLAVIAAPGDLEDRLRQARTLLLSRNSARIIQRNLGIYYASGQTPGKIAFLFPGEGARRAGMLRDCWDRVAPVARWFAALDAAYATSGEAPPSRLLVPPDGVAPDVAHTQDGILSDIAYGGQISTVANLAFAEMLEDLGVSPDALAGHSNGEHAAAMVACLDYRREAGAICNWLRRASLAGQALPPPTPPQAMFAVGGAESDVIERTIAEAGEGVYIAMDNCPHQTVIGGAEDAVDEVITALSKARAVCGRLPFKRAYHTPLFAEWGRVLADSYRFLDLKPPRLPFVSCYDAQPAGPDPDAVRAALTNQWTSRVRLRETVICLHDMGVRTFIEVGCDDRLSAFVQDTLRDRPHLAVATQSAKQGEMAQIRRMIALLHIQGVRLDPDGTARLLGAPLPQLKPPTVARRIATPVPLPPPLWTTAEGNTITRQRALIEAARRALALGPEAAEAPPQEPPSPGLLGPTWRATARMATWSTLLSRTRHPFLGDHALGRGSASSLAVLPFTGSLVLIAEAARRCTGHHGPVTLRRMEAVDWLALDGHQLALTATANQGASETRVALSADPHRPAVTAYASFGARPRPAPTPLAPTRAPAGSDLTRVPAGSDLTRVPAGSDLTRVPARWNAARFYRDYAFHGPCFQVIHRVDAVSAEGVDAELRVRTPPGDPPSGEGDMTLLDAAGQLVAFWMLEWYGRRADFGIFPYAAREAVLAGPFPPPGSSVTCRVRARLLPGIGTEADITFLHDGQTLASIAGLGQRIIDFPPPLGDWILGDGKAAFSRSDGQGAPLLDLTVWRPVLEEQSGIWARALAHRLMTPDALEEWLRERDTDRLLDVIAAREGAVLHRTASEGVS